MAPQLPPGFTVDEQTPALPPGFVAMNDTPTPPPGFTVTRDAPPPPPGFSVLPPTVPTADTTPQAEAVAPVPSAGEAGGFEVATSVSTPTGQGAMPQDIPVQSRFRHRPASSFMSLSTAGAKDISEIVTGTTALMGMAMRAPRDLKYSLFQALVEETPLSETRVGEFAGSLSEILKKAPQAIKDRIVELANDPVGAFERNPVFTGLDALSALGLGGTLLRGSAKGTIAVSRALGAESFATATEKTLSTTGKAVKAGRLRIKPKFSENPLINAVQKGIVSASGESESLREILSLPGVRSLAPIGAINEEARMALAAGEQVRKSRNLFFSKRSELMKEINDKINGLPEGERRGFVAMVEGRALPMNPSPELKEAMKFYKAKVLKDTRTFDLPDVVAKRVAYQPLNIARQAKFDEALVKGADVYKEASKGNRAGMEAVYSLAAKGDEKAQRTISAWNATTDRVRRKQALDALSEFADDDDFADPIIRARLAETVNPTSAEMKGVRSSAPAGTFDFFDEEAFTGHLYRGREGTAALGGSFLRDKGVTYFTASVDEASNYGTVSKVPFPKIDPKRVIELDISEEFGKLGTIGRALGFKTNKKWLKALDKGSEIAPGISLDDHAMVIEEAMSKLVGKHDMAVLYGDIGLGAGQEFALLKPYAPAFGKIPKHALEKPSASTKRLAHELTAELVPTPVYFPHVFEKKIRISDFMPSSMLQRFKPGFLKARAGKGGYIQHDPAKAIAHNSAQQQKFLLQKQIIDDISSKFAEPLPKAKDLKPGYKVFAPDGYLKFFQTNLKLDREFFSKMAEGLDVDESYVRALTATVLESSPHKQSTISVGRQKLMQIPDSVALRLQSELTPIKLLTPEIASGMKLFYDKPLDAFRTLVLGTRPAWVVNNLAGNILLSKLKRVDLIKSFSRLLDPRFERAIKKAIPEVEAGGFRRSEARLMGASRLQPNANVIERAASTIADLISGEKRIEGSKLADAIVTTVSFPIRAVKGFVSGTFEFNARMEDHFRKAVLIDRSTKRVQQIRVKEFGNKWFGMDERLDQMLGKGAFSEEKLAKGVQKLLDNPKMRAEMVEEVNDVLNDYSKLSKFERAVVRRAVPFWSWWKFMNTFALTLAVKDPMMAQTVRGLSAVGNDINAKEWKDNGLDVRELRLWQRGAVVMGPGRNRSSIQALNFRAANPLSTLGPSNIGFSPMLNVMMERITGRQQPLGIPFTSPNVIESSPGRFYMYDPKTDKTTELPKGPLPPLGSHLLRNNLPPIADLERLVNPHRRFSAQGIFDPVPRVDRRGRLMEQPLMERLSSILGAPLINVDKRQFKQAKVGRKQAKPKIKRQMRRIEKAIKKRDNKK